jgi:hypothetical protein
MRTVTVDGSVVNVMAGSLHVSRAVGRTTTAACNVWSDTSVHFRTHAQVTITDDTDATVFTGYIENPDETQPGFSPTLEHTLTFVDQWWLAQKRRVAASFTNQTGGAIARYMITNVLAAEGVTIGQINDGATPGAGLIPPFTPGNSVGLIPEATFSYCTVAEALDACVQSISDSGVPFYCMIDQSKKLYFVPYTAIVNATLIDGTQVEDVPSVHRANPTYRTAQFVLGGTEKTVQQDESRKGDSNTIAWPMKFALSTVPTITVNAVAKTVGINGLDTGKDFYWSKGDPNITQDSAATKLTSSDTLRVLYYGQYPNVTRLQDNSLVTAQAAIDGTSGIIEDAVSDSTLTSSSSALARATALMARYGIQNVAVLSFSTLQSGFAPGQLVTVNLPQHNLNSAQMLIESVDMSDSGDNFNLRYQVNCVLGPADSTWSSFFSKLFATPQLANAVNIGLTQATTILQSFSATVAPKATLAVLCINCPIVDVAVCGPATIVC